MNSSGGSRSAPTRCDGNRFPITAGRGFDPSTGLRTRSHSLRHFCDLTAALRLRTRSRSLANPTRSAETIFQTALPLLARETDGTAFRLIGVGVSNFAPIAEADPLDLGDPDAQRRARVEDAIEAVRDKFGAKIIGKGRGLPS